MQIQKTKNLIKHFAYLQGYQKFEDTDHEGMVTQAVLINLDEVTKNLRTMFTAVLKFSRKPYWKLKSSLNEEKLDSNTTEWIYCILFVIYMCVY